jgi:hypothetical protein
MDRVLRPGGKAVLVVSEVPTLRSAVQPFAWRQQRLVNFRILGQRATIFVYRKDK